MVSGGDNMVAPMARTDYSHGGKEQLEQRISQRLDRIEAKRTTLSDGLPPESKPKSFWLTESYKRLLDTLQLLLSFLCWIRTNLDELVAT